MIFRLVIITVSLFDLPPERDFATLAECQAAAQAFMLTTNTQYADCIQYSDKAPVAFRVPK